MKMTSDDSTLLIWTYPLGISLGICALFSAYIFLNAIKKAKSNFPPGPMALPIVGYLPFLTQHKHLDFMELGKKYGDVFSVRLGSQDAVVMHGGDVIIESLNNPALYGRSPDIENAKLRPTSIILGSDFNSWKEQRKFVLHYMKDLGLDKTKLEQDLINEIKCLMNILTRHKTQPIDVKKNLLASIINNMFTFVFGKRFKYDSPELKLLQKKIKENFEHLVPVPIGMAFPWLRYIPLSNNFLQSRKIKALNETCDIFFRKQIDEHMETIDPANVRDFIDRYLIEMDKKREKNTENSFNYSILLNLVRDLIIAGSETVQTSILWLIYMLAAFPEVQKKVQKEIMEVIGPERTPELMDMKKMPYTHAVLFETMRWKTVAPLSLPRYALTDTTVGGYNVPKGTVVFHNLWAAHHDERLWKDPEEFTPERFLSEDGKSILRSKYFMPLSRGGRGCPGESMAILEIFLYCTSILRDFDVVFPDEQKPTFKVKCTITCRLEPYLVRFIPKD